MMMIVNDDDAVDAVDDVDVDDDDAVDSKLFI